MSGWTVVNSQGEIVSGDEASSDTSESSLEVVSPEDVIDQSESFRERREIETADEPSICKDLAVDLPSENQADQTDNEVVKETTDVAQHSMEKEYFDEKNKNILNIDCVQVSHTDHSVAQVGDTSFCNKEISGPLLVETEGEDDIDPSVDDIQLECSSFIPEMSEHKQDDQENDAGLDHLVGACCAELLLEQNVSLKNQVCDPIDPEIGGLQNEESNLILNVSDTNFPLNDFLPELDDVPRSDSDSDSDDFVCLEPERQEELNFAVQEQDQGRVVIPLRVSRLSPSIGPDFNFMRNEAVRRHESDDDDRDEDTESSTEDCIDDRIESEQSEAGSNPYDNYDVGDLSSFDIGDIPLVVGNVPRNYRHQPNTNLTNILNTIVVLSAILTMGISLGISVATDLEIEEWQRAHEMESEKVKTLEEQALTLEKLWNHYKRENKELEELVTLQDKREEVFYMMKMHASDEDNGFHHVLENLNEIRNSYQNCIVSKHLEPESCYSSISPSLTRLKASIVTYDKTSNPEMVDTVVDRRKDSDNQQENVVQTSKLNTAEPSKLYREEPTLLDREESANSALPTTQTSRDSEVFEEYDDDEHQVQIQRVPLQLISREIYNKKSERDSVQIPLDVRQLQQSLTREQERALHWQQLYLSERRQREKERENEEWEDERDRDREEERLHADRVECLQKLMSTNLTTLTQHVLKWNVSVFDDFANLSMLMSIVGELQQSVVSSVHRVWDEAEEVMGHGETKGSKESDGKMWNNFPNKKDLTIYFTKLLDDVKEEVEDVLRDDPGLKYEDTMLKGDFSKTPVDKSKSKKIFMKFVNILNRTKKSVKKLGKKVVGFLGKMKDAWKNRQNWMTKMGSFFIKNQKSSSDEFEKLCKRSSKDWLSTDKAGNSWVNMHSGCIRMIRSDWQKKVHASPCKLGGLCNLKDKEITDKNNQYSQYFKELFLLKKGMSEDDIIDTYAKYSSVSSGKLKEFMKKYASSGLVLGIDVKWAECSMKWWSDTLNAIQEKTVHIQNENKCHWVQIPFSYSDTIGFEIIDSLQSWKQDFQVNDFQSNKEMRVESSYNDYDDDDDDDNNDDDDNYKDDDGEGEDENEKYKENILIVELVEKANASDKDKDSSKIDSLRNEKNKPYHLHENKKRINLDLKNSGHGLSGEWHFKKAKDREFQRKEEHRSDWLFDRAEDRAEGRREMSDNSRNRKKTKMDPNWFLEQGNEREKVRRHDHQADWFFDRANDRKEHHRKRKGKKEFEKKKYTKKNCHMYKKNKRKQHACKNG